MSYSDNSQYLDDQDKQQNSSSASTLLSGGGSGVLSASAGATPAGEPSKPTSSGSWTNLQSYLNANTDQAAKIGQDIAGSINQQGQAASDQLKNDVSGFNNQVTKNSVNYDPNQINTILSDPTKAVSDPNQVAAFQADYNASYNGPKSLQDQSDWTDTTDKVNQVHDTVGATQSEFGRDTLLQKQYARPDYNQGMQNLDQLLLSGNQDAKSSISSAANQWAGLQQQLSQNLADSQTAGTKAAQTAQDAATQTKAAYNTAQKSAQADLNNRVSTAQTQSQQNYNDLVSAIQNNQFTQNQLAMLGLTDGQHLYNVGSSMLAANPNATLQNVATAEDLAKFNALATLSGTQNIFLPTVDPKHLDPNGVQGVTDFQKALTNAGNAYNSAYQNTKNAIQNIYDTGGGLWQSYISSVGPHWYGGIPDRDNLAAWDKIISDSVNSPNTSSGYIGGTPEQHAAMDSFLQYYNSLPQYQADRIAALKKS